MPGSRLARSPRASSRQRVAAFCGSWAMLAASEAAARRHSVGPWLEAERPLDLVAAGGVGPQQQPAGGGHVSPDQRLAVGQQTQPGVPHRRGAGTPARRSRRPPGCAGRPLAPPARAGAPPAAATAKRRWRGPTTTRAPARAGTAEPGPGRRRWSPVAMGRRNDSATRARTTGPPSARREPSASARASMTKVEASPSCRVCNTRRPRSRFSRAGRQSGGQLEQRGRRQRAGQPGRDRRPDRWPARPGRRSAAPRRWRPPAGWAAGRRPPLPAPPAPAARPPAAHRLWSAHPAGRGRRDNPETRAYRPGHCSAAGSLCGQSAAGVGDGARIRRSACCCGPPGAPP